jgi:hypothetical protein
MQPIPFSKYGPKSNLSPSIGDPCPLCGRLFAQGDYTTLIRRTPNGTYADDGAEVHFTCVARRLARGTYPPR